MYIHGLSLLRPCNISSAIFLLPLSLLLLFYSLTPLLSYSSSSSSSSPTSHYRLLSRWWSLFILSFTPSSSLFTGIDDVTNVQLFACFPCYSLTLQNFLLLLLYLRTIYNLQVIQQLLTCLLKMVSWICQWACSLICDSQWSECPWKALKICKVI